MEAAALPAGVGIAQRPLAEDRGRVITSKAMARFSRRPGFWGSSGRGLNWRGRPLESLQVIIDLIGATTTSTGLKVYARLDPGHYEKGIKVTDQELAAVNIERDQFHPDWNYTIHPTQKGPLILS